MYIWAVELKTDQIRDNNNKDNRGHPAMRLQMCCFVKDGHVYDYHDKGIVKTDLIH